MTPTRLLLLASTVLLTSLLPAQEGNTLVPRSVYDLTLQPAEINFNPGPEYSPEQQDYAMVIGIDRTPKGRLWAAWVGGGDSPLAYFVVASSDDDGQTWSHPRLVIRPGRTPTGLNRSVIVGNLWTDPTGKLWLFYDQSLEQFDGRAGVWAITCDNPDAENPTWSEPRRLWHGMSLNKPTVLSNGDWLLPVSLWDRGKMRSIFQDAYKELDSQRMAHWFASSDQGKTWTRRGGVAIPGPQFDEHMLVELKDGRLWMLARNNDGIAESFSSDQGRTWSAPVQSKIQSPSARFFLRRLQSGNLLLVKNGPINQKTGRSHMTAFLSDDEGKTWQGGLIMDERKGVSYPDGFQAPDGKIYIVHDRERDEEREVLLAKFTEEDILAKDFISSGSEGKILVTKGLGSKAGEFLPNGIQLASQWPPRDQDPRSTAPMPVPYLEKQNIPAVIPINRGRELFVDDYLIEDSTLTRTFHTAQKYEGNPVFKAETAHELDLSGVEGKDQAVTYLGHGGAFYNPAKKHFEMFYTASWRGGLALATSKDLIHWERPDLGVYKDNLILPPGRDFAGFDNAVWLDLSARDPNQRYKAIIQRGAGHTLHTSPNGLVWSNGIDAGKAGDYCSFFHNPFRNVWVQSIKRNSTRGRARYYFEHPDFLKTADRGKSIYWINADELDLPDPGIGDAPQLYSLNGVAYESLLLGQFYILLGPDNKICYEGKFPKITEIHLGFSRDGFHWSRPADRQPFIAATRKDGAHDRAYIHGTNGVMLVHEDKLWFPYCAYSGLAPNGHRGMYTGASIGMATLRRDGFASMDAKDKPGVLTTRPVAFHGRRLFVNIDNPDGELRVEILDENQQPIAPFTKANSVPVKADSTLHEVTWKGVTDLDAIRGKPVRFRFHLSNGSLYAFWVSPDANGASRGYLGAGGPGYDGVIDTKGRNHPDHWKKQAALDAQQDFTTVAYDGVSPNKMVCDTTLRELPDQSWALYMLAGDDFEPSPKNYIGVTRSADQGRTWSPLKEVPTTFPREGKTAGQGATELLIRNNELTLFFSTHSQTWGRDWKSWLMRSQDNGHTWSNPEPVPGRLQNFTFIRNSIQTRDGRIIVPFQHYLGPPEGTPPPEAEEKPWHGALRHYVSNPRNGVLISSDGGKTWSEHGDIRLTEDERYHGWAENNIVELADGRIAMIIRADRLGGVLYYAESKDGGKTWPEFAVKSAIPNPGSKATLYSLGGDNVALVHTPDPKRRSHLALWISFDGMKTWPYQRVLVPQSSDGPNKNVNYPDGFVSKDKQWLNFAYDDARHRAVVYRAKLPPLE